ncbi:MAG: ABC transporter substrate-binding protein [Acidobacteriaceae bacterium]|nr:ABC transporter substrate-binding protein [Acidobacteriaceae bacterium]
MNRRTFLHLAALSSAASLAGCRHAQSNSVIWALGWIPDVEYGNLWTALDQKYFAKTGAHVSYIPGGPNAPQPVVMVAAEEATLGDAEWLPFTDAVLQGNDFVIIAAQFPVLPTGLITLPSRPIHKPKDMIGARFLVQGPSERSELLATFKLNKLPLDYKLVPVGFSPEALLEGQGDAYFCYITNQPRTLEKMGLKRGKDFFVTKIYELGYRVPSSLLFVPRRMVRDHREQLIGFLQGLLHARETNLADKTLAPRLAAERYGGDLGLDYAQQLDLNIGQLELEVEPGQQVPFSFSPAAFGPLYAAAEATGRIGLPPPERLFDLSLLHEAFQRMKGNATPDVRRA